MKNKAGFFLCTFFLLFVNQQIHSQKRDQSVISSKNAYAEKIYLQLNNSVFKTNSTIWFKATVTDLAQLPTKLSAILYVELIDFDKHIIDKKKLKIENGTADSFFDLSENLPSGRYVVRAYTEWNKNFDSEFTAYTYIDIINPKKVLVKEDAIKEITLTETASKQFELSAKAYPKVLSPKYTGKLKMYIYTDSKIDSIELKKDKDESYSFKYLLPKDVIKARMEIKLDSVKLRNNNLGFVSPFSKTVAVNKNFIDLQFFPEGGKLVDGIASSIAFKALDYNNKGILVTGNIVDQDNAIVMPFQSNSLGMGVTYLQPDAHKKYYASIKNKLGIEYKYALPQINNTGVVIKVKELKNYIIVTLNSNDSNQEVLNLKVQSRGVEYENFTSQFKDGVDNNGIEKNTLPEGIIKFTVLNKMGQVLCERLFFNYKEEENLNISAIPNFKKYSQRDKVFFDLATKDKDSIGIKSNLSMLVINKEQLGKKNDFSSNILSYFLLTSELRGTIEQPTSYFNKQNLSRKRDMDALLLTQGWSNYKYENSTFKTDFKFLPEKKLTVSGTVRSLLNSKKLIKDPIELTMVYGPLNVMTQKVDTTGHFKFQLDDYYKDDLRVVIQSKNENGKKKDFTIDLDKSISPMVDFKSEEEALLTDKNGVVVKQIERNQDEEKFKTVNGAIALNEVKVTNLSPARKKMIDSYGVPDKIIDGKDLLTKVKKWHSGLYSVLQSDYPDDIYIDSKGDTLTAHVIGTDRTIIIVDGIRVKARDYLYLEGLPVEEIKSVEVIKRPKRSKYSQDDDSESADYDINQEFTPLKGIGRTSVICIFTYAGKGLFGAQRTQGISKGTVPGFATKREFYTPKYEDNSEKNNGIPDLRSVIQWVPNINTDADGKAQVSFYNSDDVGDMIVIIEGITQDGKIGYYETNYTVGDKAKN